MAELHGKRINGLLLAASGSSSTGFKGVSKVGCKFQARFYDKSIKRQRAIPGLFETAVEAAQQLAALKDLVEDECFDAGPPRPQKKRR